MSLKRQDSAGCFIRTLWDPAAIFWCVAAGLFLLTACYPASTPLLEASPGASANPPTAMAASATETASRRAAQPAAPSATLPRSTQTPAAQTPKAQTPTALPVSPMPAVPAQLRLVYAEAGNLYLRDGAQAPRRLTRQGSDRLPTITADGQKIFFYRGELPRQLYVINADGSGEQALTSADSLAKLGYAAMTEPDGLTLIPGTHRVLFDTRLVKPNQPDPWDSTRTITTYEYHQDLYLADAETGQLKRIFAPGKAGAFQVSPDGKLVAYTLQDRVGVKAISGQPVQPGLLRYTITTTPDKPDALTPDVFWGSDSMSLIIAMPVETAVDLSGPPPAYTMWRYALDGSTPEAIPLDPPPMGSERSISPDGQWMLYNSFSEETWGALYLADLRSHQVRQYAEYGTVLSDENVWSPDSRRFVYSSLGDTETLGQIQGEPARVNNGKKAQFVGWLDNQRFLYAANHALYMGQVGGEPVMVLEQAPAQVSFVLLPGDGSQPPSPGQ